MILRNLYFFHDFIALLQVVPLSAAVMSMLPFVLVMSVDLKKLREWKLLHGRASFASGSGEACEEAVGHHPSTARHAEELAGHVVMLEEGFVPHRDLDVAAGLAIGGHALALEHGCGAQQRQLDEGDVG
jgi:hypothetical protein